MSDDSRCGWADKEKSTFRSSSLIDKLIDSLTKIKEAKKDVVIYNFLALPPLPLHYARGRNKVQRLINVSEVWLHQ